MTKNILLTGIPRSGTTLAAARLDAEKNTVCLNEPEWQRPHPLLDAKEFARAVKEDFAATRRKLLAGDAVPDKRAADGSAVTNYYENGMNIAAVPLVRKNLPEDFTLAMKHNGPYLAALPELIALGCFEIRAVVRHPLPVLRSWRRLDLPVSRGEMPNAVQYWPEMKALTQAKMDLLEKQARMFELMFTRIMQHAAQIQVVRYEEMRIQDSGFGIQEAEKATGEDENIIAAIRQFAPMTAKFYEANGSPPTRG